MENTLEVRWFVPGIPPATVQNWFNFQCPGKLLTEEVEIREDLYAYQKQEYLRLLRAIAPSLRKSEEINLKLREGNLELKIREQKLGSQKFINIHNSLMWEGNIEKWRKWTEEELEKQISLTHDLIGDNPLVAVLKKRRQRIDHKVKSELTWLKIENEPWWTVAFEMISDSNKSQQQQIKHFQQSINRASIDYYGPKLSLKNSYGYGYWMKKLEQFSYSPVSGHF